MKTKLTSTLTRRVSRALHLAENWTLDAVDRTAGRLDAWLDRLQQGLQSPPRKVPGRIPDGD